MKNDPREVMSEWGEGFFIGALSTIAGLFLSIVLLRMALLAPICLQPWSKP